MIKIEAITLEEAYQQAAKELSCTISNLEYEVIQYPSKGMLGLFRKSAIIVASCKKSENSSITKIPKVTPTKPTTPATLKVEEIINDEETPKAVEKIQEKTIEKIIEKPKELKVKNDNIVNSFFDVDTKEKSYTKEIKEPKDIQTIKKRVEKDTKDSKESIVYDELALLIENQLKELLAHSCFEIDVVEVDVRDNTALIFIDGNDAALLIGKEGYRYNALSYMIFNWLHAKYELFIKLEIAEFLTTQQDMIKNYMKPVIENVEKNGKGKTRFLDGILVQIALEQLRERFPNKYVAVKTAKEGKKFVVINDFNNTKIDT